MGWSCLLVEYLVKIKEKRIQGLRQCIPHRIRG